MPTSYRQVRIFVLPTEPEINWVENVVGRVIRPAVAEQPLEWFWFSRYGQRREGSSEDTDLSAIPAAYATGNGDNAFWRSVRFRLAIDEAAAAQFEARVMDLIRDNQYAASSFFLYPWIDDLAENRFLAPPRTPARRETRAGLLGRFLGAASSLYVDALGGPDPNGQFQQEINDAYPWGLGSSFEPMRHLFVNLTGAPTQVVVENGRVAPHPAGEPQVIILRSGETMQRVQAHNWHR